MSQGAIGSRKLRARDRTKFSRDGLKWWFDTQPHKYLKRSLELDRGYVRYLVPETF